MLRNQGRPERSAAVPTEHHVHRDQQEERAEQPSQEVGMQARAGERAERRAEEEAERQQQRDLKIDLTRAIIPEGRKQADGRQQDG